MKSVMLSLLFIFSNTVVAATDLYIYPNDGQSQEKQRHDRFQCHVWAAQQSGFDPSSYRVPQPVQHRSGRPVYAHHQTINPVTAAAGGAALGAVGGAIAGNAGKGAAIGAGVGALVGAFHTLTHQSRERERIEYEQKQYATVQAQQVAEVEQLRNDYNRAISACLEGRGYTVK